MTDRYLQGSSMPYCRHRIIELISFSPYPLEATCMTCNAKLFEEYLKTKYYDADHSTGYWIQTPTYNSIINPSIRNNYAKVHKG